jgi:hypothetical protein
MERKKTLNMDKQPHQKTPLVSSKAGITANRPMGATAETTGEQNRGWLVMLLTARW